MTEGTETDRIPEPEAKEEEAPPKRTRRPPEREVSVIGPIGQSTIVQWMRDGDYHKSTIPTAEMVDGKVRQDVLDAGEDPWTWEAAGLQPISVEEQGYALRRARIFDPEDFGADPGRAIGAIQRLIQQRLTRIVKENKHA